MSNIDGDSLCVQVEAYYFSSAAGRARITLGNRRFGEGGFMSAGRQQARPVPQPCAGKVCPARRPLWKTFEKTENFAALAAHPEEGQVSTSVSLRV